MNIKFEIDDESFDVLMDLLRITKEDYDRLNLPGQLVRTDYAARIIMARRKLGLSMNVEKIILEPDETNKART